MLWIFAQCAKSLHSTVADYDVVRKMRASILVLGPLLAREKTATVSLPGGCAIGERPIDIHLEGLRAMGADIEIMGGYVIAQCEQLKGAQFKLHFPSVTGTINLLTAAALAKGETILENVAREPEVIEVAEALIQMGAEIEGHGSSTIKIQGKEKLKGLEWTVQPDRIQFLTYLAAAAITGGEVECSPYRPKTLDMVFEKFMQMGCELHVGENSVKLKSTLPLKPIDITTEPFPGFPTDAQAQFVACLTQADTSERPSHIKEHIFEKRFQHVSELRRMGAKIHVDGNEATVYGTEKLSGASVMASDLRASACLVLAGLIAEGETKVLRVYHLDRGYEDLEGRLQKMGANIRRIKE
jgi:UDP-N-acetylglucosamine 1-carboxyvinyltransferase